LRRAERTVGDRGAERRDERRQQRTRDRGRERTLGTGVTALLAPARDEQDAVIDAVAGDDRAEERGRRVEVSDGERGGAERDRGAGNDVDREQAEQPQA